MNTVIEATSHTWVWETMGTVLSARLGEGPVPGEARERIRGTLDALEDRFSLYRAESEATAVARGAVDVADASPRFRAVWDQAEQWRRDTDDAFTPISPAGTVDLSGIVKAIAIDEAGVILSDYSVDWAVGVGGDVLTSGLAHRGAPVCPQSWWSGDDTPWVVGIIDPTDRSRLASRMTCLGTRRAVATSGTAERGEHIWRCGDAQLDQVSVVAPDIITADVLATAIISGGLATLDLVTDRWPVEVLAFGGEQIWATAGFRLR